LGVSDIKDGVVVGHERIAQDPELAADGSVSDDAANTSGRSALDGAKVEALGHGELLAGDGERDFRDLGVAGEGVHSFTERRVFLG
jgi:hypothetical protein